jgi:hypothetical protein
MSVENFFGQPWVGMMVPDYVMIAEAILYSEGFNNAKSLAQKVTQLYKLSSEMLSRQSHYDFGIHALKSVLVMAGASRRRMPTLSEDIILIRAMRDSDAFTIQSWRPQPNFPRDSVSMRKGRELNVIGVGIIYRRNPDCVSVQ